ncbi:granulin-like [Artemia franciscana]|uniref:granulin-like n=1 Tax=Artemia franciscana TaxID=6661 RepID=UPI0032DA8A56
MSRTNKKFVKLVKMKAVVLLCLVAFAYAGETPEEKQVTCFDGTICPYRQTCCPNTFGGYTCCAFDTGVCCGDLATCCPYMNYCGCDGLCYPVLKDGVRTDSHPILKIAAQRLV